jgi:hypothetical protein
MKNDSLLIGLIKRPASDTILLTRRRFLITGVAAAAVVNVVPWLPSGAAAGVCPARAYGTGPYGKNQCYNGHAARLTPLAQTAADIRQRGFRWVVAGDGRSVRIEFSEDLSTWTPLAMQEVVAPIGGVEVNDPSATNVPRRFYRARWTE